MPTTNKHEAMCQSILTQHLGDVFVPFQAGVGGLVGRS